ncbi:Uma2 family endonuclease [Kamptonema sp. UHCC 0994]|uniref:Uma2 family endonuclease n=1 Tax=Kamptonema sp. UHCC 0994 TaxID=3031329 RepID=UPI0023B936E6|nr:Uma2 family endonuclease [Kamptonema sp. UHCC 0994]MDF0554483.1 Uma2 family endonuclease [Kamptonema sp. UHCC 0994]
MTVTIPIEGKILLHNVSWDEFENILIEMGETRGSRIAYDRGTLEIVMPLQKHEYFKEVISDLIKDLAEELDLDYECLGSTTWKRRDRLAGVEPDNCFYIQNESLIRGNLKINLLQDPPPDLFLEIDYTSKSLNSLAFPNCPVKEIPDFVRQNLNAGRRAIRRLFREWVKTL